MDIQRNSIRLLEGESSITLNELRDNLQQIGKFDPTRHDDSVLVRFLRARQFNLEKSQLMISDYEDWRNKNNIEDIVQNFAFTEHKEVHQVFPRFYHGIDKQGRPIFINQHHNLDAKKLFAITTEERLLHHHIREQERCLRYRLPACSIKAGTSVEQVVLILDAHKYPFLQFQQVKGFIQKITSISSDYYPETLAKIFIINTGMFFPTIWTIFKNFFDKKTQSKISILGTNYQKDLLEYIDADQLPKFYGGTCTCVGGCENGDFGPWSDGTVEGYPKSEWDFSIRDCQTKSVA
ncbi:CRAL-TRIO domain-containing protein [Globomyces pollinis-pini]|nr:CRAL-TRIO domain-containing protein [Globomyces pollinis-pini]